MAGIWFESIDCDKLHYTPQSCSWWCEASFCDLKDVDTCIKCKRVKQRARELRLRKGDSGGEVLRLASYSLV